jgi:glutathione synthase/RimK-type ligase-like ATP-grasp enzyme
MNKLVVLTKNSETYFIKRLIEEVGQSRVQLFNPWADAILPEAESYLMRTTGVYGNDLDLLIAQSLPQERIMNPLPTLRRFRSKSVQYLWFEELDFPLLHWLPLKGTDLLTIEKFFRLYPEAVVKPLKGQGGWGVEVLKWSTFKSWWKKKQGKDEDYLIQPFIKGARELRYFFIKDGLHLTLERKARSGITANFKTQGSASVTQLPVEFQATIDRLIEKSGAYYGAIDLFIDDGNLIILELNTVPGVEQLEQVSGLNIIRELLKCQFFLPKG